VGSYAEDEESGVIVIMKFKRYPELIRLRTENCRISPKDMSRISPAVVLEVWKTVTGKWLGIIVAWRRYSG
jgi:hypothetical protein